MFVSYYMGLLAPGSLPARLLGRWLALALRPPRRHRRLQLQMLPQPVSGKVAA